MNILVVMGVPEKWQLSREDVCNHVYLIIEEMYATLVVLVLETMLQSCGAFVVGFMDRCFGGLKVYVLLLRS